MPGPERKSTPITVGTRVTVTTPPDADQPEQQVAAGTVVDDYADSLLPPGQLGRTWAPTRRWAIALDDGRLVFAADNDITPT
ncbi:hypothetical protein [Rhodococcus qingshengii]|uniref:hypothetical protein n=1 Tax=Rhodococcus qingshengii TaxID=334542 RepID=UPI0022B3C17C|nr:hypothetical protein [Rhodococcus qingshengii]MCZ4618397.1 hypothetical protein [Rhodococcus qingshengii]